LNVTCKAPLFRNDRLFDHPPPTTPKHTWPVLLSTQQPGVRLRSNIRKVTRYVSSRKKHCRLHQNTATCCIPPPAAYFLTEAGFRSTTCTRVTSRLKPSCLSHIFLTSFSLSPRHHSTHPLPSFSPSCSNILRNQVYWGDSISNTATGFRHSSTQPPLRTVLHSFVRHT
jgi:hypothetical protein